MVFGDSGYGLRAENALDTRQYRAPELARPRVSSDAVGYGDRGLAVGSYAGMTSAASGPLNYAIAESGGVGQGYGNAEGNGSSLGGGGGREVFT